MHCIKRPMLRALFLVCCDNDRLDLGFALSVVRLSVHDLYM